MGNTVLDEAARELEELVKSDGQVVQQTEEEKLADALVKSASADDGKAKEVTEEKEKGKEEGSEDGGEMQKSLAGNEEYQRVVDVTEPLLFLGQVTSAGIDGLTKSLGAVVDMVKGLEEKLALSMRAQALLLRGQKMAPRKPMLGVTSTHTQMMAKSEGTKENKTNGSTPFTASQLEQAATLLLERGKLPPNSGAWMNVPGRGPEALYKALGADDQQLFADVIAKERLQ